MNCTARLRRRSIAPLLLAGITCLAFPSAGYAQESKDAPAAEQPASEEAPAVPAISHVTTLEAAAELAYRTNPALLSERARLHSTNFRLPQARSQSGPQVRVEAGYGYQRDGTEQPGLGTTVRTGWTPTATAVLTQPLFTFGRNAAGERAAIAQIEYQRAALAATEQQVMLKTIAAYVGVRRERDSVQIARDNLRLLQREMADNAARLSARDTTRTDVQQVAARMEIGKADLRRAQRQLAAAESDFLSVVGAPAGELDAEVKLPVPNRTLEEAYEMAQRDNPVLAAAYARERISRSQASGAKSEWLPRVDLRGTAGIDHNLFGTDRLRQTRVRGEVVVSTPIFQSGALAARVGEADAANDADWRMIDQVLRDTRQEVMDSWNEWLTAQSSIDNLVRAVKLAEQAYEGTSRQERVGMRTTLDVLDLARDLLVAKQSLNQVRAAEQIAAARVLAAVGRLAVGTVAPQAAVVDEESHFRSVRRGGDIPVLTPVIQALDRVVLGSNDDREARDETGNVLTPPVPAFAKPEGYVAEPWELDFEAYLKEETLRIRTVDFAEGP